MHSTQGSYSRCVHLVDCPLRLLLRRAAPSSSLPFPVSASRFRFFFCNVILTSRNLSAQMRGMEHASMQRMQPPEIRFWGLCMSPDLVSPRIGFNAAARLTHREGRYAFLASFSNIWKHSCASSDLSSLFKCPITVHFVHFLSLYAENALARSVRRCGQERQDVAAHRFFK